MVIVVAIVAAGVAVSAVAVVIAEAVVGVGTGGRRRRRGGLTSSPSVEKQHTSIRKSSRPTVMSEAEIHKCVTCVWLRIGLEEDY